MRLAFILSVSAFYFMICGATLYAEEHYVCYIQQWCDPPVCAVFLLLANKHCFMKFKTWKMFSFYSHFVIYVCLTRLFWLPCIDWGTCYAHSMSMLSLAMVLDVCVKCIRLDFFSRHLYMKLEVSEWCQYVSIVS